MISHPAYPTTADLRRHGAAMRLANREHDNNARIHAILTRALVELNACDLHGYSLVPGMDLTDVYDTIQSMLPALTDNDRGEALNEWAAAECEGVL